MKGKLLGSLESKIMNFFWQKDRPASITDLHHSLSKSNPIAYTTVSTVVGRLVDKGLLSRHKVGSVFLYSPLGSQEDFLVKTSRRLIKNLIGNFGDLAIAGFVDELKTDPKALKRLQELSHED
jgi:predicted transcriptional regulator